jgi:hypothetical protein
VRRAEHGLRIVLERRDHGGVARPRPPGRAEKQAHKDAQVLALMRQQLAELLDEQTETRLTMRHLVFVEKALAKKGLRVLHKLPVDVLQSALGQLEGLVTNWSPVGLAHLRSKMAVALIDREHLNPDAEADAYRTAALLDSMPLTPGLPVLPDRSDEEALAAAYATLGDLAPGTVEMQGELGSRSARAATREIMRPLARQARASSEIKLRELHG